MKASIVPETCEADEGLRFIGSKEQGRGTVGCFWTSTWVQDRKSLKQNPIKQVWQITCGRNNGASMRMDFEPTEKDVRCKNL